MLWRNTDTMRLKRYLICSWLGHRREPWKFDSLNRCMRCGAP